MAHFKNDEYKNVVRAGVIGHAVGDALGVPVESMSREEIKADPVREMTGFGTHYVPEGSWSDNTSMEIALMQSVVDCKSFSYRDVMEKFCSWCQHDEFTATGHLVRISGACAKALNNYGHHGLNPTECGGKDEYNDSNDSLMRILPVAFACDLRGYTGKDRYDLVRSVSSLTNAHPICIMGCHIYVNFICHLLSGKSIMEAYAAIQADDYSQYDPEVQKHYARILKVNIARLDASQIVSDDHIVHMLEATLWCLLNTMSYEEAVLKAVNLGEDTDTAGAVTGSMAGIAYGYDAIPERWISKLQRLEDLLILCDNFTETLLDN